MAKGKNKVKKKLKMGESNQFKILDYIVIIVQLCYQLSIVDELLTTDYHIGLIIFMILSYIIRFKKLPTKVCFLQHSILLRLFFAILFFDIIQSLIIDIGLCLGNIVYTINCFLFADYLYNVFKKLPNENKISILKPYVGYGMYNVFAVLFAALLITLGVLSASSNPVSFSILESNMTSQGTVYTFPGFLSIAMDGFRLLTVVPILTGLSNEPHVLCFLIIPAMFFMMVFVSDVKKRVFLYVLFGLFLVIAMSTTAIVSFLAVLLVDSVWNAKVSKNFSYLIVMVAVVGLVLYIFSDFIEEIQLATTAKVESDTGSKEYSSNLLLYVVTPTGLFGTGNAGFGDFFENTSKYQIGLVTSVLDVVLYIILVAKILKIVFSKDENIHFIGLGCLYFSLHVLKLSFLAFSYPYLLTMIFIVVAFSSPGFLSRKKIEVSE